MLFNPLVSAGSGLLVYLTGRRLSFTPTISITLAIIYAFGTMTWVYAKSFFSDPLITLWLLLAFYGLLSYRYTRRRAWIWVSGASLGLAALTKPSSLVNVPVLTAYLIYAIRTEAKHVFFARLLDFAIPLAIGVLGMMAYNWWRFESPLDTGYRNVGWTFSFLKGLYGMIASPGKGYLLYNPISLGAIVGAFLFWRRHRPEFLVITGVVVTSLVFLAKYDHWHGGGCWGPRLLLPITPFLILPLGSLLEEIPKKSYLNLLLATLIALSVIIQILGVSVGYARFLQKVYGLSVDQYYQRITFEIPYSPLIGQWPEMREVFGNLRDPARRAAISQIAFEKDADMSGGQAIEMLATNLPDFWFIYLHFVRDGL
jgi:4-amino-4-deoxy-L-arabinose transferase-like glycosyltransferase